MDSIEQWRDVVGYVGLYQVSDRSRVRSLDRSSHRGGRKDYTVFLRGKIMTSVINANGYHQVTLCREGKRKTAQVHILALEAFVGPRPDGADTRHLDGNRANSYLYNIKWGTKSENAQDQLLHGTHVARRKTHCPREHVLALPNLTANSVRRGWRSCLACQRGRAWVDYHPRENLQEVSNRYYREIMQAA
jgi:hypothetical protein